jgi:hypothetical protein
VFDRVAMGRTLKCLAVCDDVTHEAIVVPPEHAMGGVPLNAGVNVGVLKGLYELLPDTKDGGR